MAKALIVPALKAHTSTIIIAHGLGDSGAGWSFLPELWRNEGRFQHTKFILPSAPSVPITVYGGMKVPGWYDITDFGNIADRSDDEAGITRSREYFHGLIDAEIKAGIPSERIILGGFSQGAAMSLVSGLTAPQKLGGIFALSGYLLLPHKLKDQITDANKGTSIFMGHGTGDPVVRYIYGQQSADKLKEWGLNVDFKTYKNMVHTADIAEINDLARFVEQRIPDNASKA